MLLHDIRLAIRSLRRSPGFLVIGILSLGLALGLNTTMFGLLDAVVHPKVPYAEPERTFDIYLRAPGPWAREARAEVTPFLQSRARSFDAVALVEIGFATIGNASTVEEATVARTSANYFAVLGVGPFLGRVYGSATADSTAPLAVISHSLWRSMLHGRSTLEGATLTIGERTYSIIGVLPPGMSHPFGAQVWLPRAAAPEGTGVSSRPQFTVARLRAGVTEAAATAELAKLAAHLTNRFNATEPYGLRLFSIQRGQEELRDYHVAMAGAAGAVLLIACANLANLMLARGLARRRDLALLMALGATRTAVVRQLLVECALIALGGGALGMLWSVWAMDVVTHVVPPSIPELGSIAPQISWRVFAFALAATAATVFISGLVPAIRSSDVELSEPLKESAGTTTGRGQRRYSILIIAQVALALVLLMGAGLLARAVQRIAGYDFGFDASRLVGAWVSLGKKTNTGARDADAAFDALMARTRSIEGVRAVATATSIWVPGGVVLADEARGRAVQQDAVLRVSPEFLHTLGVPVIDGRDFAEGDRGTAGVVIVDQRAAKRLWPDGHAVGRMVKIGRSGSSDPWLPVVGMARDASLWFMRVPYLEPEPVIYVVGGAANDARARRLVARVSSTTGPIVSAVQREIGLTTGKSPTAVLPWTRHYDNALAAHRFIAKLFGLFGFFALTFAAVGLYGVLSYAVGQRMREFAVRMMLGASRRDVVALVLRDGMVMVLAGTAIGGILAIWSARLLEHWLYTVDRTDVISLVGAEVLLALVALAACVAPALRGARARPLEILRAV